MCLPNILFAWRALQSSKPKIKVELVVNLLIDRLMENETDTVLIFFKQKLEEYLVKRVL